MAAPKCEGGKLDRFLQTFKRSAFTVSVVVWVKIMKSIPFFFRTDHGIFFFFASSQSAIRLDLHTPHSLTPLKSFQGCSQISEKMFSSQIHTEIWSRMPV